jgi:hypothetical protein
MEFGLAVPTMEGLTEERGTEEDARNQAERMEAAESNATVSIETIGNVDFGRLDEELGGMETNVKNALMECSNEFQRVYEDRRRELEGERNEAMRDFQNRVRNSIDGSETEIRALLEDWSEAEKARLTEERNRVVSEFQGLCANFALETMQDFNAAVGLISAQYGEAFRVSTEELGKDPNEVGRLLSIARAIEFDCLSDICSGDMYAHDMWLKDAIAQTERDIEKDLEESIDRMNAEYAAFCRAQGAMDQQRTVVVQCVTAVDPLRALTAEDRSAQVETVVGQVRANCEQIEMEVDQQLANAANVSPETVGALRQAVHDGTLAAAEVAGRGAVAAIDQGANVITALPAEAPDVALPAEAPAIVRQAIVGVGETVDRNMRLLGYDLIGNGRNGVRGAMVNVLRRACAADAFGIFSTRALFSLTVGGVAILGGAWWFGGATAVRSLLAAALARFTMANAVTCAGIGFLGIGTAAYFGQPHHDEQPHHDGE